MLFHTATFAVFFLTVITSLRAVSSEHSRKLILLASSCVFYMWWNPVFIVLLATPASIDFMIGKRLAATTDARRRKRLLLASCISNLGLLAFFKYANFIQYNVFGLAHWLGVKIDFETANIILPIGISFYTFQSLSYTIDVYRNEIPAVNSPLDFAVFATFFPQLVAGPIVRARDFLPQLRKRISLSFKKASALLFLSGLVKKVVVGDNLAPFVDATLGAPERWPSVIIWLGTVAFAVQIYCDFSGYTDMAIAVADVLGFTLPKNFEHPYIARNPSDFWQRWHISLSSWLRDYLYIPLGGNRKGEWRTVLNLFLTMLLGGLWHGASWNFVLWGLLHGCFLVAYRLFSRFRAPSDNDSGVPKRIASILLTQYLILLSWIPFRITNTRQMWTALQKFIVPDLNLHLSNVGIGTLSLATTVAIVGGFLVLHIARAFRGVTINRALLSSKILWSLTVFVAAFLLTVLWPVTETPFIYFQF